MDCKRCGHHEDMHPGHGDCRFHLCECQRFESSRYVQLALPFEPPDHAAAVPVA